MKLRIIHNGQTLQLENTSPKEYEALFALRHEMMSNKTSSFFSVCGKKAQLNLPLNPSKGAFWSEREELRASIKRLIPWLGKMIADKAHLNTVAPLDAENALKQAEALLAKGGVQ